MKVVILAGGYGTRITEESQFKPKPMIEIGEMPILWHIMKLYSHYGFHEFVICAGYKQHIIKQYFADYFLHTSDVTFDFRNGNEMVVHHRKAEPWQVTVVDTGLETMTGGRVKRIKPYIGNEPFFLTYGDGVSDVNLSEELEFHKNHGKMVTISSYSPRQRFGIITCDEQGQVTDFSEKPVNGENLINIGFMICQPEFVDLIEGDLDILEKAPMAKALEKKELMTYQHNGFWACMDTMREKEYLEKLWAAGQAPWKVWK